MNAPLDLSDYQPRCQLNLQRTNLKRPSIPAIDFHCHFADLYSRIHGGRETKRLEPEKLVLSLQSQGIEAVVNLDGFWDGFLDITLEKVIESTREFSDFFYHFVSVDTRMIEQPDFAERVRRHLHRAKSLGFCGVKLFKEVSLMVQQRPYEFRPGRGIRIDDERLAVIWQTAAKLDLPVLVHIADPKAFFDPVDAHNERYLELQANPNWSYHGKGTYSYEALMQAQENLLARHSDTTFVIPHVGSSAEDLAYVAQSLARHANLYIDIAARIDELGRQPHTARDFFCQHSERILFGTDAFASTVDEVYSPYFNVLETKDDYLAGGQWPMYGLHLPPDILRRVYRDNALTLLAPK